MSSEISHRLNQVVPTIKVESCDDFIHKVNQFHELVIKLFHNQIHGQAHRGSHWQFDIIFDLFEESVSEPIQIDFVVISINPFQMIEEIMLQEAHINILDLSQGE